MRKFYTVLFLLIIAFNISFAQYLNVMISNQYNPNEVSIMIDPKNPNRIVAGANAFGSGSYSAFYYSTNAGINWSSGFIQSNLTMPYGDPVILVDTNSNFYYIQNSRYQNNFDRQLVCKSTNGGVNWSNGVTYGLNGTKMQDKPWGCIDLTHSPYGNNIYITWTEFDVYGSSNPLDSTRIMFVRSTDGGLSLSTPKKICRFSGNALDNDNTVEGAVPCVGPNGELYVSWAGPLGILFNKSTNGGTTWMATETIAATSYPGGWVFDIPGIYRCNGLPVIQCDSSNSPFRGTLYINWTNVLIMMHQADNSFLTGCQLIR
ncbi:MAG: sialidase family protein [Ignavibacteriae bacterium]|nr:sialidase family protein [Ignavibacteriota bacterium]